MSDHNIPATIIAAIICVLIGVVLGLSCDARAHDDPQVGDYPHANCLILVEPDALPSISPNRHELPDGAVLLVVRTHNVWGAYAGVNDLDISVEDIDTGNTFRLPAGQWRSAVCVPESVHR